MNIRAKPSTSVKVFYYGTDKIWENKGLKYMHINKSIKEEKYLWIIQLNIKEYELDHHKKTNNYEDPRR